MLLDLYHLTTLSLVDGIIILNKDIPVEGRLDLLKILLAQPLTSNKYIKSDELANLEID